MLELQGYFPECIMSQRKAFSLIELIVVIALIVIIAAAAFVAIDPARRLNAANNSTRWADTTAILEAIKKYQVDNNGSFPATAVALDSATGSVQIIGESVGACGSVTCTGQTVASSNCGLDSLDTDLRPYLKTIPFDPKNGSANDTRYYVDKDEYGIVTVGACDAEAEGGGGSGTAPTIEVTR